MSTYDVIKNLCDQQKIAVTALEKELGFGRGSIGKLRTGSTSAERLQKIADYFGVSVEYLMTGQEPEPIKNPTLTARDERDIKKDVDSIMAKIESGEAGPASYDGQPLSPESAELFKDALEVALRQIKILNKEKYNPHKNKK